MTTNKRSQFGPRGDFFSVPYFYSLVHTARKESLDLCLQMCGLWPVRSNQREVNSQNGPHPVKLQEKCRPLDLCSVLKFTEEQDHSLPLIMTQFFSNRQELKVLKMV